MSNSSATEAEAAPITEAEALGLVYPVSYGPGRETPKYVVLSYDTMHKCILVGNYDDFAEAVKTYRLFKSSFDGWDVGVKLCDVGNSMAEVDVEATLHQMIKERTQ